MKVAVVIVNYRTTPLIEGVLDSIRSGYRGKDDVRAVVVDGFSDDGSLPNLTAMLQQQRYREWVQLLPLDLNGGFGWANNQAILRLLQGSDPPSAIHLLNPDAELLPDSGTALIETLESHANIGAVGSQLIEPDGTCATSAFRFPTVRGEFGRGAGTGVVNRLIGIQRAACRPALKAMQVDWVTGASVLLRADALRDAGLFDDSFFLYHEEVELMWRLHLKGWTTWHEPKSRVLHQGGAATGIHGNGTAKSRPAYWYESRRLLFSRTKGRSGAFSAALAWSLGHAFWTVRRILGMQGRHVSAEGELKGVLRSCIEGLRDGPSRVTSWQDDPGTAPQWLERSR